MGELIDLNSRTIADGDIPGTIARDSEVTAAMNELNSLIAVNYFKKTQAHNTTGNPDNHPTGLASNDANIDGNIKGWHFVTSLRANDSTFGVQVAFCDTQNGVKYRRKTSNVWQPWITIV